MTSSAHTSEYQAQPGPSATRSSSCRQSTTTTHDTPRKHQRHAGCCYSRTTRHCHCDTGRCMRLSPMPAWKIGEVVIALKLNPSALLTPLISITDCRANSLGKKSTTDVLVCPMHYPAHRSQLLSTVCTKIRRMQQLL